MYHLPTLFALQTDMVKMFIPPHKFGACLQYYDSQLFVLVQHEIKALSYVLQYLCLTLQLCLYCLIL